MRIKMNVPKLRFTGFKEEWTNRKYAEIFTFRSTNSYSRDFLNYDHGDVKNIHYGDIHTKFAPLFDVTKENVPFVNQDVNTTKIPLENYCKVGDLIITDASEDYDDVGKCIEIINLNGEKVLAGLHTILARPEPFSLVVGFSAYLMQNNSFRLRLKTVAQGTKVLSISTKQLSLLDLNIPSIAEQQKIASFLAKIDKKLTQLKKKKELLEQYKKGMMQKIFSQEIRFKDEIGEEFPKWEEKALGEVGQIIRGASPRPQGDKRYYGGSVPRLMVKDVTRDGKYVTPKIDFLTEEGAKLSRPCKAGTLTIVCSGTVGIPSFLAVDACIHDGFLALVDIDSRYSSDYIYHILTTLREKFESSATHGGVFTNLTTGAIKDFTVLFPSLTEQKRIATFLTSLDDKIRKIDQQITLTQTYKEGLLQQMFV